MAHEPDRPEPDDETLASWTSAIWGSRPARPEEPGNTSEEWLEHGQEIWARPEAGAEGDPDDRRAPLVDLPVPAEDIIPVPSEPAIAPPDPRMWGEQEPLVDVPRGDIWGGGLLTAPRVERKAGFVLPERWAAAPRRRSLLRRWLGAD